MFKKNKITEVDDRLSHVAFIMDGNGRWANRRGMPREFGHKFGAEAFMKIVRYSGELGIKHITFYTFSTENWKRPKKEVDAIMGLLDQYLDECDRIADKDNFEMKFIGNLSVFDEGKLEKIRHLEEKTKGRSPIVNIAINYGAKEEIVHAANEAFAAGASTISEADINAHLYTVKSPDVDLIIRTGGDYRISNFLLWQSAYAELYFTDVLWPDFDKKELDKAIADFYSRKRRYGGV